MVIIDTFELATSSDLAGKGLARKSATMRALRAVFSHEDRLTDSTHCARALARRAADYARAACASSEDDANLIMMLHSRR